MAGVEIRVEQRRFFRACTAGLSEKTAIVDLVVDGDFPRNLLTESRIRAAASTLCPQEPLYGVTEPDWPTAFLVPADGPTGDGDERWLGDWLVALTVAIQRWGRDPVWRGRVCHSAPGRLRLALPWYRSSVFDDALALAAQLIEDWTGSRHPESPAQQRWLRRLPEVQQGGLPPNTLRFAEAAVRRGMPVDVLPSFVQIGWGASAERFDLAVTGRTSWMAMGIAKNKGKAIQTLADAGLPVTRAALVRDAGEAQLAADQLGWPVVVKPVDQDGGEGVVTGIRDAARLRQAFQRAARLCHDGVLVERHYPGEDHRLLVVRGRVVQVVRRAPAMVVGDGLHTVARLIDHLNADPRRGTQRYSLLKTLVIDADLLDCLAEQGLDPDSVPPEGNPVRLARTANISTGGTAQDVTAITHPDNIALAVRAARIVGLDLAGVDFLCPDIGRPWHEVDGVICEVNGQPGFRPHWLADPARDINGEILDILFGGRPARVPTAAITGTNGKTTTCEMLARIWTTAGRLTGVCTTVRTRIGDHIVSTDNLSGQPGARIILNDPGVQAAVLEMPRKGLIHFGHPCDRYDVSALLNVQDDHIGVDGIDTIEQMAELKAEVLERATDAVVVNAHDPLCLAMRARARTNRHILVARTPDLDVVAEHRRGGGEAVFTDDRDGRPWIILAAGAAESALMPMHDIPATRNGLLRVNEDNAMFAAAVAWAQGIDAGVIREALGSFDTTGDQNPGRFTPLDGLPFDVLVDFAHNPDGVRGVCAVATALPVSGRRLLCSLNVGSRHPGHVDALAPVLAGSFDEFVIGCDPALVGECPEYAGGDPAAAMVARTRALLLAQGVAAQRITGETDRLTAIRAVLDRARPGDLVVLLADLDEVRRVIEQEGISQRLTPGHPWDD